MAGLWMLSKSTSASGYKAITTDVILPQYVSGDDLVKPEYIVGFYAPGYGMDIGIAYQEGKFRLFYSAAASTCSPQWEPNRVWLDTLRVSDRVTMKATLQTNQILIEIYKDQLIKVKHEV